MDEPDDLLDKIRSLRDQDNPLDYSIDIEDPKINRYKAYASIELDLKIVKRYLKALQAISESMETGAMKTDELTQTFERSLYTSSIISYARCFTETKGRGVQLNPKDCFKGADHLMAIHGRLMEVRHQHLAHAGMSDNEFIYAKANFKMVAGQVDFKLSYGIILRITHSDQETEGFMEVVDHTINFAANKRDLNAARFKQSLTSEERNALLKKAMERKK